MILSLIYQAKHDGEMLTIMFIDIDGLKKINDTLGHSIGDCLLRNVSERLTHCVRIGGMVARIGSCRLENGSYKWLASKIKNGRTKGIHFFE